MGTVHFKSSYGSKDTSRPFLDFGECVLVLLVSETFMWKMNSFLRTTIKNEFLA